MVDDRGQAYTLEGFVGALIVLTALLFVFQSIVLTPTTAGTVDQDVKAQLRVQANDALRTVDSDGTLENLTRYWNASGGFAYTNDSEVGYGSEPPCAPARSPVGVCDSLGETLHDAFTVRGYTYNLYVSYQLAGDPTEVATERVVYRGAPSANAVTATHTVVLYDDDRLTAPDDGGNATLESLGSDGFYAPDVTDGVVYNVLEVRLVVW